MDRCYYSELADGAVASRIELHSFADASEKSYGACVYLRYKSGDAFYSTLVASKTRVAPTSKQTIPRLELLSCLVSARLTNKVRSALEEVIKIDEVVYWSDSSVAIHWIRSNHKEYKQFVENRVQEIRHLTAPEAWRYCPTQENPADLDSRGATAAQLARERKWWHGPSFLVDPANLWPNLPSLDPRQQANEELKGTRTVESSTCAIPEAKSNVKSNPSIEKVIDVTRYSRAITLFRVTSYVLRFVNNLKSRVSKSSVKRRGLLATEEVNEAERIWLKQAQAMIPLMGKYKKVKLSLGLFEDNDWLLRCYGRLENSPLPYESRFPVLLPSDHHLT